jgi:hypothetical protein
MCRYYLRVQTCYPIAKHSNKGYSELMAYVKYSFPPKQPTQLDWIKWSATWRTYLGQYNTLHTPLGRLVNESHIIWQWQYDPMQDVLIRGGSKIYTRSPSHHSVRTLLQYTLSSLVPERSQTHLLNASCTRVRMG